MSAIMECFEHILTDHRTKGHATLIGAAMREIDVILKSDKELEKQNESLRSIATESKTIIEGIQKKLGVFTTTEALQRIDALMAVAEAAEEHLKHCDAGGARLEDALWK